MTLHPRNHSRVLWTPKQLSWPVCDTTYHLVELVSSLISESSTLTPQSYITPNPTPPHPTLMLFTPESSYESDEAVVDRGDIHLSCSVLGALPRLTLKNMCYIINITEKSSPLSKHQPCCSGSSLSDQSWVYFTPPDHPSW